ncbi:MAG: T9SS type A sorting domain-containing protein [Chitinophagales bacterium]|nr:T9SS type A sorting domain-containing protein [Chitinophagales bacterium]
MQQILSFSSNVPTFQRSNVPTFQRSNIVLTILFVAILAANSIKAQETEYNPCAEFLMGPQALPCFDDTRTCDEFEIQPVCSPGYCWSSGIIMNNAGIPANGIVENKVIEIGSPYTVTQNVRFINCTFRMLANARINISPVGAVLMKVSFENCNFYSCDDMWYGIVVNASAATGGLLFSFFDSNMEDAYIGLTLDETPPGATAGPAYQITNNTFRNNYIGISNLRKNGRALNTSIRRNTFFQSAALLNKSGSLAGIPMPNHPVSFSGIYYSQVVTTVGVNLHGEANLFTCLFHGMVTDGNLGVVSSVNNTFKNIKENGIWTTNGQMTAINCRFQTKGKIGIMADAAVLTASTNQFSGDWLKGIWSKNNLNSQLIRINLNNTFTIDSVGWQYCIQVERPQSTDFGVPACIIDDNDVDVNGAVNGLTCIQLEDYVSANDEAFITGNTIDIQSTIVANYGISAVLGNSNNLRIEDNNITFGPAAIDQIGGHGIQLVPLDVDVQSVSEGHKVGHNTIAGANTNFSGPMLCAIHSYFVTKIEYCENDVDYSTYGLHFVRNCSNVYLRQNHMHHHRTGLLIAGSPMPGIGNQYGRGNTWNINHADCIDWAVSHVPSSGGGVTSFFRVPEFTTPPFKYMPDIFKISPDPTVPGLNFNWFLPLGVDTDYCVPEQPSAQEQQLNVYEKQLVDGQSPYTGVVLEDLKQRTYTKLLFQPDLRPTGSPEAAFFYSLANTSIASLAEVIQKVDSSLAISATDQALFTAYHTFAQQMSDSLILWDAAQDYTLYENLTESWFSNRLNLLQQMEANAANVADLINSRNDQVSTGLQQVRSFNAAINVVQAPGIARRTLYDIWLHRLLNVPMDSSFYQQIMALALDDSSVSGDAVLSAAHFVAPCDQYLFPPEEGEVEERAPFQAQKNTSNGSRDFRLTPNPSNGLIEVSVSATLGKTLLVVNAIGQTVQTFELTSGTNAFRVDLSNLGSGLYWGILLDAKGQQMGIEPISINH